MKTTLEKSNQERYLEIIEDLAELPEWELHSFCLKESDLILIQAVLDYKHSTNKHKQGKSKNAVLPAI